MKPQHSRQRMIHSLSKRMYRSRRIFPYRNIWKAGIWTMSRHGHLLKNPDQNGVMICPESGFRYQLADNRLRCLDLAEDSPLPAELSKGAKTYDDFKTR